MKRVCLIIYRRGTEADVFYNVPVDEAKLTADLWAAYNDQNVITKPAINCIFHSDQGETSILLSEIAGFSIGENN